MKRLKQKLIRCDSTFQCFFFDEILVYIGIHKTISTIIFDQRTLNSILILCNDLFDEIIF